MLFRKYTTGFPMTAAGRALARQRTQADMGVLNENTGLPFQSMPRASPRDQKPAKTGMVKGGTEMGARDYLFEIHLAIMRHAR